MPGCSGRLPWPSRHDPSARTGGFFHSCTKKKATRRVAFGRAMRESIAAANGSVWNCRRTAGGKQQPTGLLYSNRFDSVRILLQKKKATREGGLFGAGYGSRTRLHGLGSRCITDIRILQLSVIIAEPKGKFNRFLSVRQSTSRGGNCCIWDFFMIGYMYQTNRRFFHETQQPSSRSHHLL